VCWEFRAVLDWPSKRQTVSAWIAGAIILLAAGLLGLQLVEQQPAQASEDAQSPFASIAESLVGHGQVRIGDTGNGDIVVLVNANRPDAAVSDNTIQSVTAIIGAMAPDRTVTVTEVRFAQPTIPTPSQIYLIEFSLIISIIALAGWMLLRALARVALPEDEPLIAANDTTLQPALPVTGLSNPASPTEEAASFAERQPTRTAQIISRWLSDEDVT